MAPALLAVPVMPRLLPDLQDEHPLTKVARPASRAVASPWAPIVALALVALWLAFGPILPLAPERVGQMHLAIGVVTLLLVFLLEHNELRDVTALQIKLDEIIASLHDADERKVGIEELPPDELHRIQHEEREKVRAR